MVWTKRTLIVVLIVLMVLIVPVLARQESADEDQYKLKDEWKNKHKVVEQHGVLTQVVFMLTTVGDQGAYELSGYKWFSTPVKYTINPSTALKKYKLTLSAVVEEVTGSFESWDDEVRTELFDAPSVNNKAKASLGRPDYKNVVTWGAISDRNVIAVTSIWYNTFTGETVDTDMVFNTYYKWGIDADGEGPLSMPASTFDIRNIGTHEAGHVCGLDDIYDKTYSAITMYGYGSFGEVKKISLEKGDITGVMEIYP
jgi:hypothetical protein